MARNLPARSDGHCRNFHELAEYPSMDASSRAWARRLCALLLFLLLGWFWLCGRFLRCRLCLWLRSWCFELRLWLRSWRFGLRLWLRSWRFGLRLWLRSWCFDLRLWLRSWCFDLRLWLRSWCFDLRLWLRSRRLG